MKRKENPVKKLISMLLILCICRAMLPAMAESAPDASDYYGTWRMTRFFDGSKMIENPEDAGTSKEVLFLGDGSAVVTIGNKTHKTEYFASWTPENDTIKLVYDDGDTGAFSHEGNLLVYRPGNQRQYFSKETENALEYQKDFEYMQVCDAYMVPIPAGYAELKDDRFALEFENEEAGALLKYNFYSAGHYKAEDVPGLRASYSALFSSLAANYPDGLERLFEINGHLASMYTMGFAYAKETVIATLVYYIRGDHLVQVQFEQSIPAGDAAGSKLTVMTAADWAGLILFPEEDPAGAELTGK